MRLYRPVGQAEYELIAASGFTAFELDDAYAARFPVQVVGARYHQELWVPAEELAEFNSHILGKIQVL